MTVGSNVSSLSRLLRRLNDRLISSEEGGAIVLESGDAPNLKTVLKNIIRAAITNTEGNDGYQNLLNDRDVRSTSRIRWNLLLIITRVQDCSGTISTFSVTM